jgi:citrate lyase beta subunit
LNSYFFIPAANENFIKNIDKLLPDYFVFDFEDSINPQKLDTAIDIVSKLTIQKNYFARFHWNANDIDNSLNYLKKIIDLGFLNFFIPKFRTQQELDNIYSLLKSSKHYNQFKIVLLIENPQALCALEKLLNTFQPYAVAFGSHDYCAEMGMMHTSENILWARNYILNFSKAAFVGCIDIASMNIRDRNEMEKECLDAFNKGFDGKILIHPLQLDVFRHTKYYTDKELEIALKLKKIIQQAGGIQNFTIANLDGIVIEKPHLSRYLKILKIANNEAI